MDKFSYSDASQIAGDLYRKIFHRDADRGGYAYLLDCLESGTKSIEQLTAEMAVSDEFVDKFTDLDGAERTVNRLHEILLGQGIEDLNARRFAARRLTHIGLEKYAGEIARFADCDQQFENQSAPVPAPEAAPLYCQWIWHALTVLCDGTVTCGLDDPFKTRDYGSVKSESLRKIFDRPAVHQRREDLKSGTPCKGCSMYTTAGRIQEQDLAPSAQYPRILVLEPSIKCNIRCRNDTCDIANDATIHLRREDFMPWPLFCKLMDEAAPHIEDLYFYNYGEPFVHPKALDMLAYAKKVNPALRVTTSTNGILLARPGMAERIVEEGLVDWVCFTIGGVDQDSYGRYHKSASFEKAMLGMRRLVEEKRRTGKTAPLVHWRYLVFHWNDSDAQIAEALRLQEEIGVDEFKFMLTAAPLEGRSLRRAPGTPGFEAISPWLAYQDDYHADPFSESGFWGLEKDVLLGPFRWSGKQAKFRIRPTDKRVNILLSRTADPMVPLPRAKLRLPWGEFEARIGMDRCWEENAIVVPDSFSYPEVEVELEVEAVFAPIRTGNSFDNRELGVMVSMVGVLPAINPFRISSVEQERAYNLSR